MPPIKKILKTCSKGHQFYKTPSCNSCPVCEKAKVPKLGFMALLSAPSRRALESKGIKTLKQLSKLSEVDFLQLHGVGPSALPKLKAALKAEGLSFKTTLTKTKPVATTNAAQVDQHINKLDPSIIKTVQALREIILKTDKHIAEHIKWNNPAFFYNGPMQDFDPKEYKRDMIVFNLHKNRVMLVWPSGAKTNDKSGLLEGDYKDGRRISFFKDTADVKAKEKTLKTVIKAWLKLVDR